MKMVSITILLFFAISINGMDLVKKAAHAIIPSSPKFEQDCVDLEFYKAFKSFPDEIKVHIWHSYNEAEGTIHDARAGKFIVPFDQYYSDEFIEKHVVRYKDPDYWDGRGNYYDYRVRDCDLRAKGIFAIKENNSPKKDTWPILSAYGVGPNTQSNIKAQWLGEQLKFELIDDQQIWIKSDVNLESKKKLYCIHPEKNQFLVGSPVTILSVVSAGATLENVTTELTEIQIPDKSKDADIRFGPHSSLFINKRNTDFIIYYDYEKQESRDLIDVREFFNDYMQHKPELHKQIYDRVWKSMHRKYSNDPKCLPQYLGATPYLIEIEDFVYPTTLSDYLLIKFHAKLPYCGCCRKPSHEDDFSYIFEDHFTLYNLKTKNFTYIGNKLYKAGRSDGSDSLPNFKTIKRSCMYTYIYDFINYQSDGKFDTFCCDDELNVNSDQEYNKFPSRKMVAIVPDDDIARLEQMMLVALAKNWCKKKSSRFDGFQILKYLIGESLLLEQDQNPFKQKRVAVLKSLTEQIAEKLKIDLQDHIRQHLNQ